MSARKQPAGGHAHAHDHGHNHGGNSHHGDDADADDGSGHNHLAVSVNPTEAARLNASVTSYGWQVLVTCVVAQGVAAALLLGPSAAIGGFWPWQTAPDIAPRDAACRPLVEYAHAQRVVVAVNTVLAAVVLWWLPRLGGAVVFRRRRGWWVAVPVVVLWHVHHAVHAHEWLNEGAPAIRAQVLACRDLHGVLYHVARVNVYAVLALASAMALCVAFAVGSVLFEAAKRTTAATKPNAIIKVANKSH